MKEIIVKRYECEFCGHEYDRQNHKYVFSCGYCGEEHCIECTSVKNYENKVCNWCVDKKQELEEFVISELGIDRAIKMLQEIKQTHGS